jgi:hypothetical protein
MYHSDLTTVVDGVSFCWQGSDMHAAAQAAGAGGAGGRRAAVNPDVCEWKYNLDSHSHPSHRRRWELLRELGRTRSHILAIFTPMLLNDLCCRRADTHR